jgi:hypothetical protein
MRGWGSIEQSWMGKHRDTGDKFVLPKLYLVPVLACKRRVALSNVISKLAIEMYELLKGLDPVVM